MTAKILHGRWQDALGDDFTADAFISDPPYGERTHRANSEETMAATRNPDLSGFDWSLNYLSLSPAGVGEIVGFFAPRTRGWFVVMTSHDLIHAWESALEAAGRYVFAPLPFVDMGSRPRIVGDGPANWAVHIVVARPRSVEFSRWGSLPGAYLRSKGDTVYRPTSGPLAGKSRIGGKPLGFMRALVRDYSREGDTVVDPYAGYATTGRACQLEGRSFVGCEVDADVHAVAAGWLAEPYTSRLFADAQESKPLSLPGVG